MDELTERLAKIEAALGDLAEAVLMGSGKELVLSNSYLREVVMARRERADRKHQALVEDSRRQRAERNAVAEARAI